MSRRYFKYFRTLLTTGFIFGIFFILPKLGHASDASPWLSTEDPGFKIRAASVQDKDYPATVNGASDLECSNLTFTVRDGDPLPLQAVHKESKVSGCYVSSSIGRIDSNGFINMEGTPYVAEMKDIDGNPVSNRVFPNSDILISHASSAPLGSYIWLNHLLSSVTISASPFGKLTATVKTDGQRELKDKAGNPLPVMGNFSVSENGEWAVVDSPGRGVIRINLETLDVLPFTDSFEFNNGSGASIHTAISSDGRYAVVASRTYTVFRIFDLSTCPSVPDSISEPVTCNSRDLNTFTRQKITDMGGVLHMQFLSDNLLELYASYNILSGTKTGLFLLAAPGTPLNGIDYLGMGDSYSSGEGAFHYELGTNILNVNMCHLSTLSYPYLIAKELNFDSFHSVACSGAKTFNLTGGSGIDDSVFRADRDNQFNVKKKPTENVLGSWLPGYDKQLKFVTENQPHLITLSAIGNDLGFADIVSECVKPGTCFPTYEDRQELFNQADSKLQTLITMYRKIKSAAPPDAQIYAVGYPQIADANGSCGLNVHLNQSELKLASSFINRINSVVKTAAGQAGVYYADVENALDGHKLCEVTSQPAVNGLTTGRDQHIIIGNESFHPTSYGQYLMALSILDTMKQHLRTDQGLTNIAETDPAFLSTIKTNRPLNKRQTITGRVETISNGTTHFLAQIPALTYALPQNAQFLAKLDGETAAYLTTDSSGSLTIDIPIQTDGIHSIDLYGTNILGESIDLAAVAAFASNSSNCGAFPVSNTDTDKDSIDDACDPIITTVLTNSATETVQKTEESKSILSIAGSKGASPTPPALKPSGAVLGAQTTTPSLSPITHPAAAVKEALNTQASKHPIRLMVALVSLIISFILILGWQLGSHIIVYRVI